MGRRSRRAAGEPAAPAEAPAPRSAANPSGMARGYARSRAKDDAVREQLEPLGPGERPGAVTVAAVVAAVLGVANIVLFAAGVEVSGEDPSGVGVVLFALIMLVAAGGMWQGRYWAVLGFQALLALTVGIAGLSLLVASNVAAMLLCLAIVGLGGWLFWKLIRAMARIQMPSRPR